MIFFDAIKTCFRKCATFKGRARKREYWFWVLFLFIFASFLNFINSSDTLYSYTWAMMGFKQRISSDMFSLVILLPSWAVSVRRLHDIGKSGWNLLWFFVPIIGWLVLIVYLCTDSQRCSNKWGHNPKIWF